MYLSLIADDVIHFQNEWKILPEIVCDYLLVSKLSSFESKSKS